MWSLCRSLMRSQRIMSIAASSNRRNLVLTSKVLVHDDDKTWSAPIRASADLLRSSILATQSMEQLQGIVDKHLLVMNAKHLVCSMIQFKKLAVREGNDSAAAEDPSFQTLAKAVLSNSRSFRVYDLVKLAMVAGTLKLHSSSPLVQEIYQILKRRLNELNILDISKLHHSLSQLQGSSDLTNALKMSLPLVFDARVIKQLDEADSEMCIKALRFAASTNLSRESKDFIADAARKFLPQISAQTAANIIYSAAFDGESSRDLVDGKMRDILGACVGIVARNLSQFDSKSLRRIVAAYSNLDVYQKELHDALWAMAPTASFEEIMRLVHLGRQKDGFTLEEAELLKDFLLTHKDTLMNVANYHDVMKCSYMMSFLSLQTPEPSSEFEELGRACATVLERQNTIQGNTSLLIRFLLDLAILGLHPDRELDLLFSEEHAETFPRLGRYDVLRLIDLERLLCLHFGESCKYVVTPELKEKAARWRTPTPLADDLVDCMRTALGGDQFLLKNVITPLGVIADLAVVMRQGEYPIALADKQFPLEDLPDDSKVVAILDCNGSLLSKDSSLMKVSFALKLRFLRAQNICPVVIRRIRWQTLPSKEKIPFVMREIKEALREGHSYKQSRAVEFL